MPTGPVGVEIRQVRLGEARRLKDIRLRALRDAPDAFGSTFEREERFPDDAWDVRVEQGARGIDQVIVVAERADRWIGMATVRLDVEGPGEASVFGVWVEPAARRGGVGRALMEAVVTWAGQRGARAVGLWVVASNTAAIDLYGNMGFRLTGDEKPVPRDPSLLELRLIRTIG